MQPAQRSRKNDRFIRFDKEDRHQEKKLYTSTDGLYDLHDTLTRNLVSKFKCKCHIIYSSMSTTSQIVR